jgi:cysteine desulfurase
MKYFDWAATSPADDDIIDESISVSREFFGNPSSVHEPGKKAREMLEQARTRTSAALGVNEKTLFFTSGGTEANHIPLVNLLSKPSGAGSILISSLEHPAVSAMAESLKTLGWRVGVVKANADGIVTAGAVCAALTADTRLVCVLAVHNETGMIQDVYGRADAIT